MVGFCLRGFFLIAVTSMWFSMSGCRGNHPWTGLYTPGDSVDNVGYKPEQPINFSHKLHAGKMKVNCHYCHSGARMSAHAGIPSGNVCIGCHKFAKTDAAPIKYLTEKYNKREAVEWNKVHDLPDYVRFNHQPHVLANVPCEKCHGNVREMVVAQQVAPLQMGWCIDCHVKTGIELKASLAKLDPSTKEYKELAKNRAPGVSCNTCHY